MVDDNPDRGHLVELIDDLAPGDQEALLREVAEKLGHSGPSSPDGQLTEEAVGEVRDRFVEDRLSGDYEAIGELLTLALLSKADEAVSRLDEPTDAVEFELEVQIESVKVPEEDRYCLRFGIINGIIDRPLYWRTCIVNGII